MDPIDLRSDTVTRPGRGMREAMSLAEVGDDVYGEDPTVRRLEERTAELLGKERALFVPTGTMANQLALRVHTRPGDEVIIGEHAHCARYESGAAAAWSGVQFAIAGRGGLFDADELSAMVTPSEAYYRPRTGLVALENTHNHSGGRVWPRATLRSVVERVGQLKLPLHLDGARLWNASSACQASPAELCDGFDTVSVCFSKGLGAPVGSAIAGSAELLVEAHRQRKMMGGGMRQSGILAAAALYALEHHLVRLGEDHRSAAAFADELEAGGVKVSRPVETNMVVVHVPAVLTGAIIDGAARRGVRIGALSPGQLRAVTHLDVPYVRAVEAARLLMNAITEVVGAHR